MHVLLASSLLFCTPNEVENTGKPLANYRTYQESKSSEGLRSKWSVNPIVPAGTPIIRAKTFFAE